MANNNEEIEEIETINHFTGLYFFSLAIALSITNLEDSGLL